VEDKRKDNAELLSELRKAQEALALANVSSERQRKGEEAKAIPSSQKEALLQKEVDKCMVRTPRVSRPCALRANPCVVRRAFLSVQYASRTCARRC
jgi:hypothetical protein